MNVVVTTKIRVNDEFFPIESDLFSSGASTPLNEPFEGAIEIAWQGRSFLGEPYFDLIFDLWAYIINNFDASLKNGFSKIVFPDQPLNLSFDRKGRIIILSVEDANGRILDQIVLPSGDFDGALIVAGRSFFKTIYPFMNNLTGNAGLYLEKISALEKRVGRGEG
jgi:hypothetical protein